MADERPVVLSKRRKVEIKTGKLDVSQPKQETDCDSQQGACRSEDADLPAIATVDSIAKNRRRRSSGNSCLLLPQDICLFCDKQRRRNRKGNEKLSKCSYDAGENSIRRCAELKQDSDLLAKINWGDIEWTEKGKIMPSKLLDILARDDSYAVDADDKTTNETCEDESVEAQFETTEEDELDNIIDEIFDDYDDDDDEYCE